MRKALEVASQKFREETELIYKQLAIKYGVPDYYEKAVRKNRRAIEKIMVKEINVLMK